MSLTLARCLFRQMLSSRAIQIQMMSIAGPGKLLTARGGGAFCGGLACYQRSPYAE
jgi:hypothetical protein